MRKEVKRLRSDMDELHLLHDKLSREMKRLQDCHWRDQAKIKHLTGENPSFHHEASLLSFAMFLSVIAFWSSLEVDDVGQLILIIYCDELPLLI